MSYRFEPNSFEHWSPCLAEKLLKNIDTGADNLLDALHACQDTFGYIDEALVPMLAKHYNLSRAEVHGVISFYHDFRRTQPGRFTIKVCQAESCQAMGSEQLTAEIKQTLGIGFHETTESGAISLEPVYCLGNCACSPNIMINHHTVGRVSAAKVRAILASLTRGEEA